MQEYNEIKWDDDYLSEPSSLATLDALYIMLDSYKEEVESKAQLLEEANKRILELEDSVEFWKQQHKEACEDYVYWKDKADVLQFRIDSSLEK